MLSVYPGWVSGRACQAVGVRIVEVSNEAEAGGADLWVVLETRQRNQYWKQ